MKKKSFSGILFAVAALFLVAGILVLMFSVFNPFAKDLVLGQMQIVLPAEATTLEKTTADELNNYLSKMTGETLTIVTEGNESAPGIYIGATEYASQKNVGYDNNRLGEGWAIKAVDGNLVLCGGAERGVLYALYHLLEDGFGVHWWTYWDEYVPRYTEARLSGNYHDSGVPAFIYREIHPGKTAISEENLFCVRNRLNGESSNAPMSYGGEEYAGFPAPHHTFNRYIPSDYFNEHPDWFSYKNGGRIPNGQLCLTNDELIDTLANIIIQNITNDYAMAKATGKNLPHFFDISPNDNTDHCACEACSLSIAKHGESGHLLQFVNKVAAKVAEVYPDVLIRTQAYSNYIDPPIDDTKPADNVLLYLADSDMDVLHSFNHKNNELLLDHVKAWNNIVADDQFYFWDYMVFYSTTGVAPTMFQYADNLKTLQKEGVDGYFAEMENCITTDFWDMKFWMCAKLMENPKLDGKKLMDEFLTGYYGDAAPYVRQYLELMNKKVSEYEGYWAFHASSISPRWLTAEDVVASEGYFAKAMEAANGDEVILKRLRHARNCLDRVIVNNYQNYVDQAAEQGIEFNVSEKETCQRLVNCLTEQIEMRGNYDYDAAGILDTYQRKLQSIG